MKNFKNKKWLVAACTVFLLIAVVFAGIFTVLGMEEKIGQNPISGINAESSKIVKTGQGYYLNTEMEEELKEEQEKKKDSTKENDKVEELNLEDLKELYEEDLEKQKESEESTTESEDSEGTTDSEDESGPEDEDMGFTDEVEQPEEPEEPDEPDQPNEPEEPSEPDEPDQPDEPEAPDDPVNKSPTIITDLEGIQSIEGTRLTFEVEAVDYKGRQIERGNFLVYVNGERTYSSGNTYKGKYQPELQDGENEITISVTDIYGNSLTKRYTVQCNASGEREIGGQITVIIDARTIGLGYILECTQDFYKGDSVSHTVMQALENNGYSYVARGNGSYGWYLAEISKPGLVSAEDINIPEPIQEKLDEEGTSYLGFGRSDKDRLGEKTLYEHSGWIYKYNDQFLDTGMSNKDAEDGDVVVLAFTLHMGNEYSGKWFSGSW